MKKLKPGYIVFTALNLIFTCAYDLRAQTRQEVQNSLKTAGRSAEKDSLLPGYSLDDVVVTATRTDLPVQDAPVPISVIKGRSIAQIGSLRLNEALAEQTGIQVVQDHGAGIQIQGLSSDYVLILIDGEPIVGRTKGNLDLTRMVVGNIDRIEVLKGPSSSLFGSEAMGGVINIITKKGKGNLAGSVRSRLRRYNTWDLTAEAGKQGEKLGWYLFANRLSSNGYFMEGATSTVTKTVAPFEGYTFNGKVSYYFSPSVELVTSLRYYTEEQKNRKNVVADNQEYMLREKSGRQDFSFTPTLHWKVGEGKKFQIRNHITTFSTRTLYNYEEGNAVYDDSYFRQLFNRTEVQYDHEFNKKHLFTAGIGHLVETVDATRYESRNAFRQSYVFGQHQWKPGDRLYIMAGFRFDKHNQYADRFSPKLAAGWKINKKISVQGSVAGGYKAPTFEQLLLNFTNPTVGYSVFGTRTAAAAITRLQQEGQIQTILIDPATIGEINAESSLAYNAGIKLNPVRKLRINMNFFLNQISHMIDFNTVAVKTNQGAIYSYFNRNRVFTRGMELQTEYCITSEFVISFGYQYLEAKDAAVWEKIKAGKMYYRDAETNMDHKVKRQDYGGLYNRSKHSGNVKIMYDNKRHDFDVSLRGLYRGRFGSGADVNGNSILDDELEYAAGYTVWNLSVRKSFKRVKAESGINNLFSAKTPFDPSTPPLNWYLGLAWTFEKK